MLASFDLNQSSTNSRPHSLTTRAAVYKSVGVSVEFVCESRMYEKHKVAFGNCEKSIGKSSWSDRKLFGYLHSNVTVPQIVVCSTWPCAIFICSVAQSILAIFIISVILVKSLRNDIEIALQNHDEWLWDFSDGQKVAPIMFSEPVMPKRPMPHELACEKRF